MYGYEFRNNQAAKGQEGGSRQHACTGLSADMLAARFVSVNTAEGAAW